MLAWVVDSTAYRVGLSYPAGTVITVGIGFVREALPGTVSVFVAGKTDPDETGYSSSGLS